MTLGSIENCDNCHRFKRIQFVLESINNYMNFCSQKCLKAAVQRILFNENEDWLKFEWISKEDGER